MEPRLIPVAAETITSDVDYTQGLIVRQYLQDGAKYYFTLHQEHYMDVEEHIPTGNYLATIFSPKGLRSFYLVPNDNGTFVMDNDEEEETPPQHSVVNEQGQLEPVFNVGDLDVPFSDDIQQQLDELNNMDAYVVLMNQAIQEAR